MTAIDPKALEAAGEVYLSEQVEMQAAGQLDWATSELSGPIQAYLDAADLVEWGWVTFGEEACGEILQNLADMRNERDEARREVEKMGKQIVAHRVALIRAKKLVGAYNNDLQRKGYTAEARQPIVAVLRDARAVLTDTAKAAAPKAGEGTEPEDGG